MSVATSIDYGAYRIANNGVEYNPQRKNNFTLIIHGLEDITRMGAVDPSVGELSAEDYIEDGQESLALALISCTVPQITQDVIAINRGNSTIKFPGKPQFNTIDIEINDWIGSNAKDVLFAWQNKCYNPRYDVVGHATEYKFSGELLEMAPDHSLVRYWEIKGMWPSTVAVGNFSMNDGDTAQTVTATLVYDWAIEKLPDDYEL